MKGYIIIEKYLAEDNSTEKKVYVTKGTINIWITFIYIFGKRSFRKLIVLVKRLVDNE